MYDVIIIGSGPAGISSAIYLKRAKKKLVKRNWQSLWANRWKNKVLKQTSNVAISNVAIVVKNVKPSKFMFKIYSQNKT